MSTRSSTSHARTAFDAAFGTCLSAVAGYLAARRTGPSPRNVSSPAQGAAPATGPGVTRGLGDGTVHLDVIAAVVVDLEIEADPEGGCRVNFMLRGHLPAIQLEEHGVTAVDLDSLMISRLAVSRDAAEHLEKWSRDSIPLQGWVEFDRRALDERRGCGPIRELSLRDTAGDEMCLNVSG